MTHTYDAAGRRVTMTTGGQPAVSTAYAYDDADRLTQLSQGAATVTITPDAAGRREVVRLPNGVTMTYGYDLNSRVSSIQYKRELVPLLDWTGYRARVQVEGPWRRRSFSGGRRGGRLSCSFS
ncbi:MAG TPA: hypothetical protein VJ826_04130 [Candidatus Polarisedimenticolaceae bacterium]|nr:hypothetical protein [Candidatus Polarisedimenticolaceae bacterium]